MFYGYVQTCLDMWWYVVCLAQHLRKAEPRCLGLDPSSQTSLTLRREHAGCPHNEGVLHTFCRESWHSSTSEMSFDVKLVRSTTAMLLPSRRWSSDRMGRDMLCGWEPIQVCRKEMQRTRWLPEPGSKIQNPSSAIHIFLGTSSAHLSFRLQYFGLPRVQVRLQNVFGDPVEPKLSWQRSESTLKVEKWGEFNRKNQRFQNAC